MDEELPALTEDVYFSDTDEVKKVRPKCYESTRSMIGGIGMTGYAPVFEIRGYDVVEAFGAHRFIAVKRP